MVTRMLCLLLVMLLAGSPLLVSTLADDRTGSRVLERIEASPQREGHPQRGRAYLVSGDYIRSGIPLNLFRATRGSDGRNRLNRQGENATLPHAFTAVDAPNGQPVVTANCMTCHAQSINGRFIVGLGDTTRDFTRDNAALANLADRLVKTIHGPDSPQHEAFAPFRDAVQTVGPHIRTKVVGTNPATKLAFVLASYRDPQTLEWTDEPVHELPPPAQVAPTDVPPLWHVREKHALFYTGAGRGDFARLMMASSLLTLNDAEEAEQIDRRFTDVLAYLRTLRPPKFPNEINPSLAQQGERLFARNCASCHGTYGDEPSYPNRLISLEEVGTDPMLAEAATETYGKQIAAYNESWFAEGPHAAQLVAKRGYIAPPLDGIWATAPYLHNGSIPTLKALLDSDLRPTYWQRSFDTDNYDLDRVGWRYEAREAGGDKRIYDTTLPGHSAAGHTYGDPLSDTERRALLEYLKSL